MLNILTGYPLRAFQAWGAGLPISVGHHGGAVHVRRTYQLRQRACRANAAIRGASCRQGVPFGVRGVRGQRACRAHRLARVQTRHRRDQKCGDQCRLPVRGRLLSVLLCQLSRSNRKHGAGLDSRPLEVHPAAGQGPSHNSLVLVSGAPTKYTC